MSRCRFKACPRSSSAADRRSAVRGLRAEPLPLLPSGPGSGASGRGCRPSRRRGTSCAARPSPAPLVRRMTTTKGLMSDFFGRGHPAYPGPPRRDYTYLNNTYFRLPKRRSSGPLVPLARRLTRRCACAGRLCCAGLAGAVRCHLSISHDFLWTKFCARTIQL